MRRPSCVRHLVDRLGAGQQDKVLVVSCNSGQRLRMLIQGDSPAHHTAVRQLLVAAFPSPAEADLVERLRREGDAVMSLVALEADRIVGHIMFSKMVAPFRALGLAPVCVVADRRRQGIAAALIEHGIKLAKADDWEGIFVLGNPDYYQRFGFSADAATAFASPYAGPHLMLLALRPIAKSAKGRIDYAPAFTSLE
jgi:putative acetyltransferase